MLAEGLTNSTFWITSCSVGRFPLRTGLSGVTWSKRREQLVWPRLGLLVRSTYDRRVVAKGSANRGLHDAHLEAGSYLRSASGILRPLRRALRPFISCWVTGSLAGCKPRHTILLVGTGSFSPPVVSPVQETRNEAVLNVPYYLDNARLFQFLCLRSAIYLPIFPLRL